jgi:D-amino-acid dehydrogenase
LWRFWRHCNARDYHDGLHAVARLNRGTMALFDALRADGVAFEMHAAGVLFAFLTDRAQSQVFADLQELAAYGFGIPERLDARAVRELEPALSPAVVGGVLAPGERHLRPESLMGAVEGRLREMDTELRLDARVTGIERRGPAVAAVRTPSGRVGADAFLIAAGAWSAALLRRVGFMLPLEPGTGYSLTFPSAPVPLRRPVYLDEARVACSPFAQGLRLAGTMELSGFRSRPDPRRVGAIARAAARYFDSWAGEAAYDAWAGMRPMTPDGLPAIGRVPGVDNVYLATGHAMLGMTLAPATGSAIADLISGRPPSVDLTPFDPARFARRGRHGGNGR